MKLLKLLRLVLSIYFLTGLGLYFLQRSVIYQPTAPVNHCYETLTLKLPEASIQSLVIHPNQADVIIYFGGNAEQVAYTAADFEQTFPNHTTYLLQYRGYGESTGQASESALYQDAINLYAAIMRTEPKTVTVIGRSLGSGVASYLASQRPIDQLVLVTPFDSIRSVAQSMLPVFPIQWLLHDHFDSISRADQIKAETLIITATQDRVIPAQHSTRLISALNAENTAVVNIEAGHNDLDLEPEYLNSIQSFISCYQIC
jgi:hypothetical protein